jgi:Tol biopolymer transport system component
MGDLRERLSTRGTQMRTRKYGWFVAVLCAVIFSGCCDECTNPDQTGQIRVSLEMSGNEFYIGECTVTLDNETSEPILLGEPVTFPNVETGSHVIGLEDLAVNCGVIGDNPRVIAVQSGKMAEIVFDISCEDAPFGRIAFTSNRAGYNYDIWVMSADGSNPINLTPVGGVDNWAAWSRDGWKLAYNSNATGNDEIYIMYHDGTHPARITDNPAYDGCPSWSPDGTKIAFTSTRDDNREIYVMNADGSDQINLTNNPTYDHHASWSPDGTKIAFTSDRDDGRGDVFVMSIDGSDPMNLTNTLYADEDPAWSPDGTRIAYMSFRVAGQEIYIMNADGTNQTCLTESVNSGIIDQPTWSPDGMMIAFRAFVDNNSEIFIINIDGSGLTNVTNDPAYDQYPAWSPGL